MLGRFRLEHMGFSAQTAWSFDHREDWLFCKDTRVSVNVHSGEHAEPSARASSPSDGVEGREQRRI